MESLLLTIIPPNLPDVVTALPPCIVKGCRTLFDGVLTDGDKVMVEEPVMR